MSFKVLVNISTGFVFFVIAYFICWRLIPLCIAHYRKVMGDMKWFNKQIDDVDKEWKK